MMMKCIQLMGLLLALVALCVAGALLGGLDQPSSASTAGAAGLAVLGISMPLLGLSSLLIIPSSAALCWPAIRRRYQLRGVWLLVWGLNGALSLLMLVAGAAVAWALMKPTPL